MRECPDCGRLYPDAETTCADDGQALALPGESDPRIGQTVGSYTIASRLGQGGMGSVYLGQHPGIGSQVAIKFLNPRFASDPVVVERFFNEARAVNLIGHENIVQIFDFGRLPDRTPYFVMEWLNGRPLSAEAGTPMPLTRLLSVATQIADALQAAHDAGIVHRDLKPDNVFLVTRAQGPRVKVLDFGIAKLASSSVTGPTEAGVVMGTVAYVSPEQAAGDAAKVSPASDIYSLGVLLYQLATGHLPFDGEVAAEILAAHLNRAPPALPDFVSPKLAVVIERCLRKRPADRFQSMRELRGALTTVGGTASPDRQRDRRVRAIVFGSLIVIAVGAAVMGVVLRARHLPPAETVASAPTALPTGPVADAPLASHSPPALDGAPSVHAVEPAVATSTPTAAKPLVARSTPARESSPRHAANPAERSDSRRPVIPTTVGDGMIDVEADGSADPH